MRLSSGYEDRKARMEMISLMDVMFLILVVFVYSIFSLSVHRGLKVDLPAAQGAPEKGERAVITLAADNTLYLNKRDLRQQLDLPSEDTIYALLVDRQGGMLWRAEGEFDEAKGRSLEEELVKRLVPA